MKEKMIKQMANRTISEEAEQIQHLAEEHGIDNNAIFRTQYRILLRFCKTLDQLEEILDADGMIVTKTYVKGRENTQAHPAIASFKETAVSAEKVISGIRKTFKEFGDSGEGEDPWTDLINGGIEDDNT